MADSVDLVFVHALNTVKELSKTGASRPPASERLRLYGLYKQAMEGDVDGVMEPPSPGPALAPQDLQREREKWEAWYAQKGLSRAEAKRRYVEALIETMRRYVSTADASELVAELEFVWNQIKHRHSLSSSSSSFNPSAAAASTRLFLQPQPGDGHGPMKLVSPMSEQDEAELRSQQQIGFDDDDHDHDGGRGGDGGLERRRLRWQAKMERAVVKLSTEVAALREQITTAKEWRSKKERSFRASAARILRIILGHLGLDCLMLVLILLWMRRRKDRRLEDLLRAAWRAVVLFASKLVPS